MSSSSFVTTISPSLSFIREPSYGMGWPSAEPTPTVYTRMPFSAASFAAATGSSSWFSPSEMTMITRLFSLWALKLLMAV